MKYVLYIDNHPPVTGTFTSEPKIGSFINGKKLHITYIEYQGSTCIVKVSSKKKKKPTKAELEKAVEKGFDNFLRKELENPSFSKTREGKLSEIREKLLTLWKKAKRGPEKRKIFMKLNKVHRLMTKHLGKHKKNPSGPSRITKSELEKARLKAVRLKRLYALSLAADKAFNKAVKKQFPNARGGDARYVTYRFNSETKKAGEKFHRIMDNYLKAMREGK